MRRSLFEYRDYKEVIRDHIETLPANGRGAKKRLAESIGCQLAYVSHVLNGAAHLSAEQSLGAAHFLGLSSTETEFFVALVAYSRAGTSELKAFYERQLHRLGQQADALKARLAIPETFAREVQAVYYGSWHYAAIHMALLIPRLQTREALAAALALPPAKVGKVLRFLVDHGIARKEQNRFVAAIPAIHLEKDSPLIERHHTNWRMRSIASLDLVGKDDLHYSGVITCSEKDLGRIREALGRCLEECISLVRKSPEEKLGVLAFDLFRLT